MYILRKTSILNLKGPSIESRHSLNDLEFRIHTILRCVHTNIKIFSIVFIYEQFIKNSLFILMLNFASPPEALGLATLIDKRTCEWT